MKVAITGAGGQVGFDLTLRLARDARAHEIVPICRNYLAAMILTDSGCSVKVGSISDASRVADLFDGCDAVVHCAQDWVGLGQRDSPNVAMIRSISRVSSVKLLIYLSSVAVYSTCIETGVNTISDPHPDEAYGKDKLMCERVAMREFSAPARRAIVLRLGHVYGPHFAWSRRILELSKRPRFGLPFAGRLRSNAVRADRVCDGIKSLLEDPPEGGIYNLFDDPQQTWNEIFAWHTAPCGLACVGTLEDDESRRIKNNFLESKRANLGRLGKDVAAGLRAVAVKLIYSSPPLKTLGSDLLAKLPDGLEMAITRKYKQAVVSQGITARDRNTAWAPWGSYFFSDPAPGRVVRLPPAESTTQLREQELHRELSRWFSRWLSPDGAWRQ